MFFCFLYIYLLFCISETIQMLDEVYNHSMSPADGDRGTWMGDGKPAEVQSSVLSAAGNQP